MNFTKMDLFVFSVKELTDFLPHKSSQLLFVLRGIRAIGWVTIIMERHGCDVLKDQCADVMNVRPGDQSLGSMNQLVV